MSHLDLLSARRVLPDTCHVTGLCPTQVRLSSCLALSVTLGDPGPAKIGLDCDTGPGAGDSRITGGLYSTYRTFLQIFFLFFSNFSFDSNLLPET